MKLITFNTLRLSVAMPLIFGLATIAAAPIVEAVTMEKVDIINGGIDVNEDAVVNASDDVLDVALWCDDHTPIQVDILNGGVDVNEGGAILANDDLLNCDLNDEVGGFPTTNQVDIINGCVDVTEVAGCTAADDATDIILFNLP